MANEPRKQADNDGLHRRGDIWYFNIKVNGKWREVTTGTRSYQEARTRRHEALEAQKQGRLPGGKGKLRFERAAEMWAAARRQTRLSENTKRTDRERLPPLVKHFAERRLNSFTQEDWKHYQRVRGHEVSHRTVNMELEKWCAILRDAHCLAPLADYRRLPEKPWGPGVALTLDEEEKLFSLARTKPEWQAVYYAALLAANTTMRDGEVKRLRLSSLDLFNRTIKVTRITTKTDAGERLIPLNETALWAAAQALKRAAALGAATADDYLFPAFAYCRNRGAAGTGYDPAQHQKTWRTAWLSLTKAAGFPKLRFHDLRHTCITKLVETPDIPDHVIMSISGHLSAEMVRYYSHIRTKAKEKAVARMQTYVPPEARDEEEPPATALN
jgi:integrase